MLIRSKSLINNSIAFSWNTFGHNSGLINRDSQRRDVSDVWPNTTCALVCSEVALEWRPRQKHYSNTALKPIALKSQTILIKETERKPKKCFEKQCFKLDYKQSVTQNSF